MLALPPEFDNYPPSFKWLAQAARDMFNKSRGLDQPMIFAWMSDGPFPDQELPVGRWMEPDRKPIIEQFLIWKVQMGAQAVALLTEAWFLEVKDAQDVRAATNQEIYKHSKRIEVINLMLETAERHWGASAQIARPKKGVPYLKQWEVMEAPPKGEGDVVFGENVPVPTFQYIFDKARQGPALDEIVNEIVAMIVGG